MALLLITGKVKGIIVFEFLFSTICGWVGHVVVKGLTFGKVDLDWGSSSESVITELIGLGILLGAAVLIAMVARW